MTKTIEQVTDELSTIVTEYINAVNAAGAALVQNLTLMKPVVEALNASDAVKLAIMTDQLQRVEKEILEPGL